MSVQLFHFTSRAAAREIIARGFNGPTCWLSPDVLTVCGDAARSALIAVELDTTDAELQPFACSVAEDVWDEAVGDFVPDTNSPTTYVWYEIPIALIAAKGRVRLVSEQERARLFSGEDA